jgi:hypothetical protein
MVGTFSMSSRDGKFGIRALSLGKKCRGDFKFLRKANSPAAIGKTGCGVPEGDAGPSVLQVGGCLYWQITFVAPETACACNRRAR